jgi:hypothetical protein
MPDRRAAGRLVRVLSRLAFIASAALLAACAAMIDMEPARFNPQSASASPAEIQIAQTVTVMPSSRIAREVPAGSRWRAVGRLSQGEVYKRVDGVFNVEARHFHEAYLVIDGTRLQGFYLPVEEKFSPAILPVQLTLGKNQ